MPTQRIAHDWDAGIHSILGAAAGSSPAKWVGLKAKADLSWALDKSVTSAGPRGKDPRLLPQTETEFSGCSDPRGLLWAVGGREFRKYGCFEGTMVPVFEMTCFE